MEELFDVVPLIQKGGVLNDVEGETPEEVFKNVCEQVALPEGVSSEQVYEALCAREKNLSTAVGNGIALPHARAPIIKSEEDQRIIVVYLKEPIEMNAPDEKKISVMFVLLTQNSQAHLKILSSLAALLRKPSFKKLLDEHANEEQLIKSIKELD